MMEFTVYCKQWLLQIYHWFQIQITTFSLSRMNILQLNRLSLRIL